MYDVHAYIPSTFDCLIYTYTPQQTGQPCHYKHHIHVQAFDIHVHVVYRSSLEDNLLSKVHVSNLLVLDSTRGSQSLLGASSLILNQKYCGGPGLHLAWHSSWRVSPSVRFWVWGCAITSGRAKKNTYIHVYMYIWILKTYMYMHTCTCTCTLNMHVKEDLRQVQSSCIHVHVYRGHGYREWKSVHPR